MEVAMVVVARLEAVGSKNNEGFTSHHIFLSHFPSPIFLKQGSNLFLMPGPENLYTDVLSERNRTS